MTSNKPRYMTVPIKLRNGTAMTRKELETAFSQAQEEISSLENQLLETKQRLGWHGDQDFPHEDDVIVVKGDHYLMLCTGKVDLVEGDRWFLVQSAKESANG